MSPSRSLNRPLSLPRPVPLSPLGCRRARAPDLYLVVALLRAARGHLELGGARCVDQEQVAQPQRAADGHTDDLPRHLPASGTVRSAQELLTEPLAVAWRGVTRAGRLRACAVRLNWAAPRVGMPRAARFERRSQRARRRAALRATRAALARSAESAARGARRRPRWLRRPRRRRYRSIFARMRRRPSSTSRT
eukprot:6877610-Prymnesium_polylepis.2